MNKRTVTRECSRCGSLFSGLDADEQLAAHVPTCDKLLVLHDGCEGDKEGLVAALGDGFEVVWESFSNEGYGHHSYDQVLKTSDGRIVHAECGGCSCQGSGSWSVCASVEEAMRLVPESRRS